MDNIKNQKYSKYIDNIYNNYILYKIKVLI